MAKLQPQISPESAAAVLIAQKYVLGFETITKNPSDKVFVPNSFQGLYSLSTDQDVKPPPVKE